MSKWFRNLKMSNKLLVGNSFAILLLITFAVVIYFSISKLLDTSNMVIHTEKVISSGHQLTEELLNLETGERGFLITGNPDFLEPYNDSIKSIAQTLNDAKKLVSDNPNQARILDQIDKLTNKWIISVGKRAIDLRQQVDDNALGRKDLENIMSLGKGKEIFDKIREILEQQTRVFKKSNNHKALTIVVSIAKDMVDQQTGQRGFLVTGKDSFLEPYYQGQKNIKTHLADLHLIIDNAYDRKKIQEYIKTVDALADRWVEEIGNPAIELRNEVNNGLIDLKEIELTINKKAGKNILDNIRSILGSMNFEFKRANNEHGMKLIIEIAKNMVDMETGVRGYLITGNKEFLEPFINGKKEIHIHFKLLYTLINDAFNIDAMRRYINDVEELAATWLTNSAKPEIDIRRKINETTTSFEDVKDFISQKQGKNIMDEIRVHLNNFIANENVLMHKRKNKSASSTKATVLIVSIGVCFAIVLILIFNWFISRSITKPISKFSNVVKSIAEGDLTGTINIVSDDEIGELAKNFTKMAYNLCSAQNSQDKLNWLSTSRVNFDDKIRGILNLKILAQKTINFLAKLLDAQVGAFYLVTQGNAEQFNFLAGYACKKEDSQYKNFDQGESLLGQATVEKGIILFNDVPEDYTVNNISSATGETKPKDIIILSVTFQDEVLGVIELGTAHKFTEIQITFLKQIIDGIGIAINSAMFNVKLQELLRTSEAQGEELLTQQEELKQSNEELEESEANLQAQQEELKSSNEELLESEYRLQAQQEELEASNRELEEKTNNLLVQQEEIKLKNIDIEEKARDLALSSKYKSEFLANMSHELRTPLNSILLLSKFLFDNDNNNLTNDQVEMAQNISLSGTELLNMIDDILDLAKIESGKTELHIETINLEELTNYVERNFKHSTQEKGLELKIEIDPNIQQTISTDTQRLEQVIKNFMSNSLKFTKQGSITFSITQPTNINNLKGTKNISNCIAISVSDTGIGIPKEQQKVIFEAFKQADGSTNRVYGGTGLGLSISRELALLMGGQIILKSEDGVGSTFTICLPANYKPTSLDQTSGKPVEILKDNIFAPDPQPTITISQETIPTPQETVVKTKEVTQTIVIPDDREGLSPDDRSLLIIEDDSIFAKILLTHGRTTGYKCLVALDGETGLELANKYNPSAIILDIVLPGIDGWIVMDNLKNNPKTRHIPVHIFSAEDNKKTAMKIGAIGFITKPVSRESLDNSFKQIEQFVSETPKRLLLVEDDKIAAVSIKKLLGNGDITISVSTTGKEAFDKLKDEHFDCMVLDLGLPDISGFDLLDKIKHDKYLTDIPVIIYTGKDLSKETEIKLEQFAESIIIKGVKSPERLLDEVSLFLHRIESNLPKEKQKMIRMVHDKEQYLKNRKILLVDDDMRNVFALKSILSKHGMQIIVETNGYECLEFLEKEPHVDLILMDIMMPKMDGYETMRRIRAQEKLKRLPIIALTAKAMKEDRAKCIESGANDYLTKPVDMDKLLSLIRVWLYH